MNTSSTIPSHDLKVKRGAPHRVIPPHLIKQQNNNLDCIQMINTKRDNFAQISPIKAKNELGQKHVKLIANNGVK